MQPERTVNIGTIPQRHKPEALKTRRLTYLDAQHLAKRTEQLSQLGFISVVEM